jgi:hypothetical protein
MLEFCSCSPHCWARIPELPPLVNRAGVFVSVLLRTFNPDLLLDIPPREFERRRHRLVAFIEVHDPPSGRAIGPRVEVVANEIRSDHVSVPLIVCYTRPRLTSVEDEALTPQDTALKGGTLILCEPLRCVIEAACEL